MKAKRFVKVHGPGLALLKARISPEGIQEMLGNVFEVERGPEQASGYLGSVRLTNGWTIPFGCFTFVEPANP